MTLLNIVQEGVNFIQEGVAAVQQAINNNQVKVNIFHKEVNNFTNYLIFFLSLILSFRVLGMYFGGNMSPDKAVKTTKYIIFFVLLIISVYTIVGIFLPSYKIGGAKNPIKEGSIRKELPIKFKGRDK